MDQFHDLTSQQTKFVENFVQRPVLRTLLVASPGTGKTTAALAATRRVLLGGDLERALIVAPTRLLAEHWRHLLAKAVRSAEELLPKRDFHMSVATFAELSQNADKFWDGAPAGTRWLFVFDEVEWHSDRLESVASRALARFPGSRALFVATTPPPLEVDERFAFGSEFFTPQTLREPQTQQKISVLAPSVPLLQRVQHRLVQLDELNWRQFETLIAQMLERDGYRVELMQGSKDGGVDVIAIKDLGDAGLFKSVWQAKKYRLDRKIGLSLVRELADTRLEHGASKALIVTTSYLTDGALKRVERDRYLLGKIDRTDLNAWIERTLRGS